MFVASQALEEPVTYVTESCRHSIYSNIQLGYNYALSLILTLRNASLRVLQWLSLFPFGQEIALFFFIVFFWLIFLATETLIFSKVHKPFHCRFRGNSESI